MEGSLIVPKEGDAIFINCEDYKGDAVIVFIDWPNLYNHHLFPIQVELDEGSLHQFDDFNHDQVIRRFNLKDISNIESKEIPFKEVDERQLTLFDEF